MIAFCFNDHADGNAYCTCDWALINSYSGIFRLLDNADHVLVFDNATFLNTLHGIYDYKQLLPYAIELSKGDKYNA